MTKNSPRIYIYKITFEEVPYYYYGVHKEKRYGEYYMGSPVTHKWCWEFYTPKKQILQLFDFTDEGWLEANLVEDRLINPFYQTDKWCLNASCGAKISLDATRKNGKRVGNQSKELKLGFHAYTKEERKEHGKRCYKNGTGLAVLTKEQLKENAKKADEFNRKNKIGFYGITPEQRRETVSKTNSQRWECCETGYVTTSGALTKYQKARGIDTSKRRRIL
jgi:hypothetical protein